MNVRAFANIGPALPDASRFRSSGVFGTLSMLATVCRQCRQVEFKFWLGFAGKLTNALMVSAHAAGMPVQGGVSRQRDANDQNTGYPRLFVCSDRKSSPSVSGAVLPWQHLEW